VQKFSKSCKIWQSCREFKGGNFLRHSVVVNYYTRCSWWLERLTTCNVLRAWTELRDLNRIKTDDVNASFVHFDSVVLPALPSVDAENVLYGSHSFLMCPFTVCRRISIEAGMFRITQTNSVKTLTALNVGILSVFFTNRMVFNILCNAPPVYLVDSEL